MRCRTFDTAIAAARAAGYARIYGIGGERVFHDLLPRADRLLITEVDVDIDGADAFFPVPIPPWRDRPLRFPRRRPRRDPARAGDPSPLRVRESVFSDSSKTPPFS